MAILSPARAAVPLLPGLKLYSRGKVRDTYDLGGNQLLVIATDGVSIFDFVLNTLIPQKGIILTALNHFWCRHVEEFGIPTHFICAGQPAEELVLALRRFSDNAELLARATVVRKLDMRPIEFIARGILTGSAHKFYNESNGATYGHILPSGLRDGDELPFVMDTPTTKATEGHDEPLLAHAIRVRYPKETILTIQIFQILASYARACGILLGDSKFEFGTDQDGVVTLGDEVGTGDSSRFCDEAAWQESRKRGEKLPPPLDKQLVRAWGIEHGVDKLNPENPDHVRQVHALALPDSLIRATTQTYRYLFWRLTGERIEDYCATNLGAEFPRRTRKIAIVVGSESDLPTVKESLHLLVFARRTLTAAELEQTIELHVMSCHRNADELREFAQDGCNGAKIAIGVGGKALALPGVLDAFLRSFGYAIPVVGVALGTPGTDALAAAELSIKELPGQPVVMDEIRGRVYAGPEGLADAIERVLLGELPPPKPRTDKPPRLNIPLSELLTSS